VRTTAITGLAVLGLGITLAGCGTASSEASGDTTAPTTLEVKRPTTPIDELFDVDGVDFHLHCDGQGDTTLLLIAGWGSGGDESWSAVRPALAEQARVCTYDRPGTGTSDTPAATQTFETEASDLDALLSAAGEPGPYVVVGHSFGGAQAVTFTSQYPDDVTGLMLVDASPATWPATACSVAEWKPLCDVFHDPSLDPERLDVFPAFDAVADISSLGDLPMTVMPRAHYTYPGLEQDVLTRLDDAWAEGAERWAALSSASTVVPVPDTGHLIQLEQPGLVIDEVEKLLARSAASVGDHSGRVGS
jgi:pimeloyl-ACP methyl ester carboxylesterase